jgi:hypothetical protein
MQPRCTQVEFTGQHVYVGLDIAKRSWKACVFLEKIVSQTIRATTRLFPGRNSALRYTLIEYACNARREDPALLKAFTIVD